MTGKDETSTIMTFIDGKWIDSSQDEVAKLQFNPTVHPKLTFDDFKYYYANLIDYGRIVLCLISGFTIAWGLPALSAVILMVSTLLDWIDGPVARKYNQCTMFGSGIHWLADVLSQVITMAWWCSMDISVLPWLTIATSIEVGCSIFDYASMVSGRYPKISDKHSGFLIVLDWTMPNNSYSQFGTFLWLAYPIYCLACCLDLSYGVGNSLMLTVTKYTMFVPSVLYIWDEAAVLVHDIQGWTEDGRRSLKKKNVN